MVHLGEYNVPTQFVPPSFARPGDTAVLIFGEVAVQVRLPDDVVPGRPVLVAHPTVLGLLQAHRERVWANQTSQTPQEEEEGQKLICERLSRIATAVIGVGGFFAGSILGFKKLFPKLFGFSFPFLLIMVMAGLIFVFERRCRQSRGKADTTSLWMDVVILTLAICSASASLCSAIVQIVIKLYAPPAPDLRNKTKTFSADIQAWFFILVLLDLVVTALCVAYMMSLSRFGALGMNIRRKFLPWFAIGAQCIAMLWTALWLSCFHLQQSLNEAVEYIGQCTLGGAAVLVGCVAPCLSPLPPPDAFIQRADDEDNMQMLPGALTSLTVFALSAICIVSTASHHDGDSWRTVFYSAGVVLILAIVARPGADRRSAILTQASCFLSLIGLAIVSPQVRVNEHWYICVAAALVSRWPAILAAIGCMRSHDVGEAEEVWVVGSTSDMDQQLTCSLRSDTSEETELYLGTDSESAKWALGFLKTRVGHVYTKACRRGADNVRLAGAILVCAVMATKPVSANGPNDGQCTLTLAIPMLILCMHIAISPPGYSLSDTFQVCFFGFALSALPYRIKISLVDHAASADNFYELSLFLGPSLLLAVVYLRQRFRGDFSGSDTERDAILSFASSAALGLAFFERLVPLALCPLVFLAFAVAWVRSSLPGMAAAVFILEARGGLSAWCTSINFDFYGILSVAQDKGQSAGARLAFLVGLVSLILLAFASLKNGSGMANGGLMCLLVPIPALLALKDHGWWSWLPGVCAVLFATARVHWLTVMVAPIIVVFSVGACAYCQHPPPEDENCWHVPLQVSSNAAAIASISALILAAWASYRQAGPAVITSWGMALLLSVPGSYWTLSYDGGHYLALCQVGALTVSMLIRRPPLLHVWYLLPGTWALSVLLAGKWTDRAELIAITVAMLMSAVMMVLPWVVKCKPKDDLPRFVDQLLGNASGAKFKRVEPTGMMWLAAGAVTGVLRSGEVAFTISAILLLGLCCVSQMICGLFIKRRERWRLVSSMLMASLTVLLGLLWPRDSEDGGLRVVVIFAGSMLAMVAAACVFLIRSPNDSSSSMEEAAMQRLISTTSRPLEREMGERMSS